MTSIELDARRMELFREIMPNIPGYANRNKIISLGLNPVICKKVPGFFIGKRTLVYRSRKQQNKIRG